MDCDFRNADRRLNRIQYTQKSRGLVTRCMRESDSTTVCEQTAVPANPDSNTCDRPQEINQVSGPITVEWVKNVKECVSPQSGLANELGRKTANFLAVENVKHPELLDCFLAELAEWNVDQLLAESFGESSPRQTGG